MNKRSGIFRYRHLAEMDFLGHAVFSRLGGVSKKPYNSLNIGETGDDPEAVKKNRSRVASELGAKKVIYLDQNHGKRVVILKENEAEKQGPLFADAAVTDMPGLYIVIATADCQAVMLCDPKRRVVANIHSGWRGSVQNIIGTAIRVMRDHFGTDPGDLLAGIGPSLGPCCAEFVNYRREIPEFLWKYRISENRFDFWRMSVDQMRSAGVDPGNIEVMGICTMCRTDLFYSYRAEGITGRFASAIGLIKDYDT